MLINPKMSRIGAFKDLGCSRSTISNNENQTIPSNHKPICDTSAINYESKNRKYLFLMIAFCDRIVLEGRRLIMCFELLFTKMIPDCKP
jgi:hypothetical protein